MRLPILMTRFHVAHNPRQDTKLVLTPTWHRFVSAKGRETVSTLKMIYGKEFWVLIWFIWNEHASRNHSAQISSQHRKYVCGRRRKNSYELASLEGTVLVTFFLGGSGIGISFLRFLTSTLEQKKIINVIPRYIEYQVLQTGYADAIQSSNYMKNYNYYYYR